MGQGLIQLLQLEDSERLTGLTIAMLSVKQRSRANVTYA